MKCPRCEAENSAGMRFCGQCAAPLGTACPSCGAANPSGNRFCGQCAAALDATAAAVSAQAGSVAVAVNPAARTIPPGELKQVSVLFCDIVDSTALTERLGAEAMHALVSAFIEASLAEVRRYEGTAPEFSGDGFMALFGAPIAHEDHVRRALLAALAIRRALAEGGGSEFVGIDLRIRIGIHTGPVVFGVVGDGFGIETAIGDTANVAARIQQAAEPGTILLSARTRRLARAFARVEAVGPLQLKGKVEPIPAFRLLGVSHRQPPRDDADSAPAAFVGRDGELAVLNNFLRQVENGQGRAVGIVGEPGIGKSRLVAEFRRQLETGRTTWVEGRCLSYGTAIPYLLVLDLLRGICGIDETDLPEAIAQKLRTALSESGLDAEDDDRVLLHLLGIDDPARPGAPSPELVKARTFEILRQLGLRGSRRHPLVIVVEDLHWVDNVSEEFLGIFAESIPGAPVLLLAAYRPGYRPPWIDKSFAGQVPLQPLSRDDSVSVVRSTLRGSQIDEPVAREIVAKADGNPFFIEQLVLHAGEASGLRAGGTIPDTIQDVVMARIDRLADDTKQLLQTAAVIGREFSVRLLRAVSRGLSSFEAGLRELSRLEFVYERMAVEGGTYVFRHALTQEAAYESLLERHRRARHRDVGHALEQLYRDRVGDVAELLALHFGRDNEPDKAVDYAIMAAEKAQRRWANTEATAYFADALDRLDTMPDNAANRLRRIDAVIKQAEVKFALGRHTEHIQALEDIRGMVEACDDPRRRAAWYYWTGFLHSLTGGRPEAAIEHCREAAAIASAAGLDEIDAFAGSCLAQVYTVAGRLHEAVEAGERALATFEAQGNLWWAGRTLWHLTVAANFSGEWEASLKYCRRALEHGITLDDLRLKSVGWLRLGAAHIQRGDVARGLGCCERALALAPIPHDAAMARAIRGYGHVKVGRFEAGIAELAAAVAWFAESRQRYSQLRFLLWLAEGHLLHGEPARARPLVEDVLAASRAGGYPHFEGLACWLMGECLADEAPAAAEDFAVAAWQILRRIGARNDLAKTMMTQAGLRRRAGDIDAARGLLGEALAIFDALGTRDEPARVKAARAALDAEA